MSNLTIQEIYCCIGHQVAGDPTQYMMDQAFSHADLDCRFLTFEVSPDSLAEAVQAIRVLGIQGAKILGDFTSRIAHLLDDVSRAAKLIGEVNLVKRENDQLVGESTIGKGVLACLADVVDVTGKQVVLLGSGSAARAVAVEFALAEVAEMVVVNRSVEHGEELVQVITENSPIAAHMVQWTGDYSPSPDTHVIVNATSLGEQDEQERVPLSLQSVSRDCILVDMAYTPTKTQLLRDAEQARLTTRSGLDVLLHQGVVAFRQWTGREPDIPVLRDALEEYLMV